MTDQQHKKEATQRADISIIGLGWATWRRSAEVGEFSSHVLVKREHPHAPGIFRIETVGSEHWVSMSELEMLPNP